MASLRLLLPLLGALASPSAAQDAPPIFRLLPRETIAALGVEGAPAVKAAFEESVYGRLWSEKEVKTWLAPLVGFWEKGMEEMKGEVGFTVADLWDTMDGGVAVAILDLVQREGEGDPGLTIGVVADLGGKKDRFESFLEKAIEKAKEDGNLSRTEEEYRGTEVAVLRPAKPPEEKEEEAHMRFAFVGSVFVSCASNLKEDRLEALLDRAQGREEENSILRSERFRKAAAKAGRGSLLIYGDLERVWKVVRGSGDPEGEEKAQALGVFDLNAVAVSLGFGKEGTRAAAYVGGARSGLFSLAQMPTGDFKTAALAPADAASFSAYRIELKKIWDLILRMATEFEGEEGEARREIEAKEKEFGFSIGEDLLASFGDEIAFFAGRPDPDDPTAEAFSAEDPESAFMVGITRATILFALRQSEKLEGYLETLLKKVGLGATLKTEEYQGRRIHSFMALMVPLSYAVAGDTLVLGFAPERVQEVLRRIEKPDTPSLKESDRFLQALAPLPKPRASVSYANAEASLEEMEGAFKMLAGMLSRIQFDAHEGGGTGPSPSFDLAALFEKFPAAALKRHWKRDSASTLVPDGDGVLWVSLGP
ncbi:MAG: hypothetical protein ACREIU_04415 [Planctomycetota bacterium]